MRQIVSPALRSSQAHEQLDGIRAEAWAKCRRYQLFWGRDVTQGFGGDEAGLDPEGGAGGGQVEADQSADFRPRPYGTQAHSSSSGLGQARQCGQLIGAGAVPGMLAGMDLQGSGPHLTQRGDAEGQGCEGVPLRTGEGCWPSARLPLGPLALRPALGTTPPPDSTTWGAPHPQGHTPGSQSRGPPTTAHPRSGALAAKGPPAALEDPRAGFRRHRASAAASTGEAATPGVPGRSLGPGARPRLRCLSENPRRRKKSKAGD